MNITILSTFVLVFLQTHFLQTHLLPVQFSSLPRGITPQGQIQAIPGGETPVISNETQKYIETEVQKAFQATLIVLSMLLILLILLPTIAAIATWFLLDKLARKSVWAEQEIESLSTDMIFQLETLLEEAKTLIQAAQNVSDYSGQFLNQSSNQSISATDEDTVNTIAIILESDQQGEILFLNGAAPNGAALNGNQAIEPEIKESGIREPEIELDIQDAGIEAPKIEALGTEQATIKQIVNNSQTDSLQLAKQYANQAEQLFLSHQLESAINAYDQAVQLDSKIAEVWNNRGVVLIKLQRYQAAIASYEKAIQCRRDYADAWNNRGVALGKIQYHEAALASYEQAIQIRSDYIDAWNNKGFVLTQLKQYQEALSAYQQAVRLNPNFYLTWYNQARCYALQGQKDQTLASLHRAIQLNPETVQSLAQNESDFSELYQEEQFQHLLCNSAKP